MVVGGGLVGVPEGFMEAEWVGVGQIVLTSACPCGVTHRLLYRPPSPTVVFSCAAGTVLAVGPEAWSRARDGGDGVLQIAYAPRRQQFLVPIAVRLPDLTALQNRRPSGGSRC